MRISVLLMSFAASCLDRFNLSLCLFPLACSRVPLSSDLLHCLNGTLSLMFLLPVSNGGYLWKLRLIPRSFISCKSLERVLLLRPLVTEKRCCRICQPALLVHGIGWHGFKWLCVFALNFGEWFLFYFSKYTKRAALTCFFFVFWIYLVCTRLSWIIAFWIQKDLKIEQFLGWSQGLVICLRSNRCTKYNRLSPSTE